MKITPETAAMLREMGIVDDPSELAARFFTDCGYDLGDSVDGKDLEVVESAIIRQMGIKAGAMTASIVGALVVPSIGPVAAMVNAVGAVRLKKGYDLLKMTGEAKEILK